MRKAFIAVTIFFVPVFVCTGAWALFIDDRQDLPGAYYGGTHTTSSGATNPYNYDTSPMAGAPGDYQFSVTSLAASKNASTGEITVSLTGPYFGTYYAYDSSKPAGPGDLYISSKGWKVDSPANHGYTDKFNPATEGWDYVIKFSTTAGLKNTFLYALDVNAISSTSINGFTEYRADQAWRGGYGTPIETATSTLAVLIYEHDYGESSLGTLTFTFLNTLGWDPEQLGYHWTMGCGNDVIEGGGTVPEPAPLLLLGLGILGLRFYWKKLLQRN